MEVAQCEDNDELFVQNFPRSLTGAFLTWFTKIQILKTKQWTDLTHLFTEQHKFNYEIASVREQLQGMSKKPTESFREYMQRWCHTPSQVQTALTEKENVIIFTSTLSSPYHNRLIGQLSASFAYLILTGERVEDCLKAEKIKVYNTLFEQSSCG